jgi:t-SNARE complex subunit (syntaxin)
MDRAMGILRMALPFVHRILPLLDGNIGTAVSNLLTPHPQPPQQHQPVDLEPIEKGLADLESQYRDLRNVVVEQNSSLKRVEDQLEMVREATDRNTLEQQELLEDLKNVGNKINAFAFLALALLAVSILLNVVLYLHIRRVLP